MTATRPRAAPTERPIPYSAPMVRARRDGLKTQTRRIVKPVRFYPNFGCSVGRVGGAWLYGSPAALGLRDRGDHWSAVMEGDVLQRMCRQEAYGWGAGAGCPYGVPGDRLWVREAYRTLKTYDGLPPRDVPRDAPIWYEADGPAPAEFGRYRHAKFMCRWMSRGLDEVVSVRVERLQDISAEDAKAEGISEFMGGWWCEHDDAAQIAGMTPQEGYRYLWERINGFGSWGANPWVWCIEFEVTKRGEVA